MATTHVALFDELAKIAEAQAPAVQPEKQTKSNVWPAARAILATGLGFGVGRGAAELMFHQYPELVTRMGPGTARIVKNIGIPAATGLAGLVASLHRKKVDSEFKKADPKNPATP